jgi:hypothetical protein
MSSPVPGASAEPTTIPAPQVESGLLDVLRSPGRPPRLIRVFTRYRKHPHTPAQVVSLLRQAVVQAGRIDGPFIVLGPAGLCHTYLPTPTTNRFPTLDEFREITEAASELAKELNELMPPPRPVVVFGADVLGSYERSAGVRGVGQFGIVLQPDESGPSLFPKRFPTPAEGPFLRVPAAEVTSAPTFPTTFGWGALLVCHDLNVYNPRGSATTIYEERASWRKTFKEQIAKWGPTFGLHLTHWVESPLVLPTGNLRLGKRSRRPRIRGEPVTVRRERG